MVEISHLNFITQFVCVFGEIGERGYIDIVVPKGAQFSPPAMYFYNDDAQGFFNMFIVHSGKTNPAYLPDFASEILQFLCNQQLSIQTFRAIQEQLYEFLTIFQTFCRIRSLLWWWLMFNPYQQPFDTLRVLTEWYLTFFSGGFPVILGIDLGPTFALGLLGGAIDLLGRLVLTMPYLPSEGTLYLVKDLDSVPVKGLSETLVKYGQDVKIYSNFPSLWTKYAIPDSLREYWLTKKPYITEFLIKNYFDLGIDFLPDRVLKDYYESLKNESLRTSLDHFDHISTNLICLKSSLLSLDFLHSYL